MPPQQEAIVVRNARKRLGGGSLILDNLNMTVSKGTIYGLLGASGCGKTTLLSCVVGVRKLDSGEIWVLGGRPGSALSSIPGPRVGYMPQEISLVQEFSAMGALYYFGRINGMEDDEIEEKYIFLTNLLQLPPKNRLVKHMSGGQQRRVSFACALIHEPELLILDEPTVGLDPLIRENIWEFLVSLTKKNGTTVVITTHYIEEAKLSNKIGLLRNGKLLSEASPDQLLAKCHCESLEEAFLILSQKQKDHEEYQSEERIETELQEITSDREFDQNCNVANLGNFHHQEKIPISKENNEIKIHQPIIRRNRRFQALMIKNFLQFIRHPGGVLFALILPLIQVIVFFNAIGNDPTGVKIAIVNHEAGNCNSGRYSGNVIYSPEDYICDYIDLSCRFLNGFDKKIGENQFYDNLDSALDAVKHGKAAGVIFFGTNFSSSLQSRRDKLDTDLNDGQIDIHLDMGDRQIGLYLEKQLYEKTFKIYEDIMTECNIPKKFADIPLRFETPIFGTLDQKISSFMAPTFLLTTIFFLATSVSSAIIIADRHEGVWDRSLVQGVKTSEILIAHILTQLCVIIIQTTVTLSISFLQYDLECRGSIITVISMTMMNGICGMCYGFLISVLCSSHTVANFVATGSFYPIILLCGCVWPIEGMPKILQWLSCTLPTTIPGIALRNVLDKGYTFDDPQVFQGYLIISGWTTALVIFCFLGLRAKSF